MTKRGKTIKSYSSTEKSRYKNISKFVNEAVAMKSWQRKTGKNNLIKLNFNGMLFALDLESGWHRLRNHPRALQNRNSRQKRSFLGIHIPSIIISPLKIRKTQIFQDQLLEVPYSGCHSILPNICLKILEEVTDFFFSQTTLNLVLTELSEIFLLSLKRINFLVECASFMWFPSV